MGRKISYYGQKSMVLWAEKYDIMVRKWAERSLGGCSSPLSHTCQQYFPSSHPSPTEDLGWSTSVTFFSFENWQSFFVSFSLLSPLSTPDINRPASLFCKFDFSTYFDSFWWQAITQHWDIHTSSSTTFESVGRNLVGPEGRAHSWCAFFSSFLWIAFTSESSESIQRAPVSVSHFVDHPHRCDNLYLNRILVNQQLKYNDLCLFCSNVSTGFWLTVHWRLQNHQLFLFARRVTCWQWILCWLKLGDSNKYWILPPLLSVGFLI